MRKITLLALFPLSIAIGGYAQEASPLSTTLSIQPTVTVTYKVRIVLKDWRTGAPVDPGVLSGYVATHSTTGEEYASYYDGFATSFDPLPAGTYSFGSIASPGGSAAPELVTLSPALVGPDGYIVVTLGYWKR